MTPSVVLGPAARISPRGWLEMQALHAFQTYWIKMCTTTKPSHSTRWLVYTFKSEKHCPGLLFSTVETSWIISVHMSPTGSHLPTTVSSVPLCRTCFSSQRYPGWICRPLGKARPAVAHPSSWLLLEVRNRWAGAVSFVWLLCRCLLFKWEVSSSCTHTQIFPC